MKAFWAAILIACAALCARADDDTLLILHTNDLHDHARADYDGVGGMAYLSGYIAQQRAGRKDVLVLNAGDVMEKGDLVAHNTQSRLMYELMGRIGFDAASPGNHDTAYGIKHLQECAALARPMAMLAVNQFDQTGALAFPPSKIFDVAGLKVGVIGAQRPQEEGTLDEEGTITALAAEAGRIEPEVDLTIVVLHLGSPECRAMAPRMPTVDVFASGHMHEAMKVPVTSETGALIIQGGFYAQYVARLEVKVDKAEKRLTDFTYELRELRHSEVPEDAAIAAYVLERERALAPEAVEPVLTLAKPLTAVPMSRIAAAAMREALGADIGFCNPGQIIRGHLPAGAVDVNAVFRTGGQRGADLVRVSLTGAQVQSYLEALAEYGWGQTQWAGFRARRGVGPGSKRPYETDLDPAKSYTAILPALEWETRMHRAKRRQEERGGGPLSSLAEPESANASFTGVVVPYLRRLAAQGVNPEDRAQELGALGSLDK